MTRWLSMHAASLLLGLRPAKLRKLVVAGKITAYPVGQSLLFKQNEIERFAKKTRGGAKASLR